jgi:hypothetical protein
MNLGQIKQKVRMLGRNYFGTDADLDPFGLDYIILESANEIARRTDCLVGRRYLSMVAGESDYCAPDIYKIRVLKVLNMSGEYWQPKLFNFSNQMVDRYRSQPEQQVPDAAVISGMNRITLFPVPSTSITNGVLVEGFAQPGDYWQYDTSGTALPNTDTTECPLPDVAHDCLVYLTLSTRALQMRDKDGIVLFKQEYLDRLGQVESYAAMYARRAV